MIYDRYNAHTEYPPHGANSLDLQPKVKDSYSDALEKEELMAELNSFLRERMAAKKDRQLEQQYGEPQRTWSYYEDMRKKDKAKYINPKTQVQMLQDATELGSTFHDGGFDTKLGRTR